MANYRIFSSNRAGLIAWVRVGIGPDNDREWKTFDVDGKTGLINIPDIFSPAHAPSKKQFERGRYVQAFQLEVAHAIGDDWFYAVTQRGVDNDYTRQVPQTRAKLHTYTFAHVPVEWRQRSDNHRDAEGRTGPAIFTAMKSRGNDSGVNRVDVWVFGPDGFVGLYQILVTSFDDGKTWRLVGSWRWSGKAYRLAEPAPYLPQFDTLAKKRAEQEAVFNTPKVQEALSHLIFEPEGDFTGIDSRAEIFLNNKVLDFLEDNRGKFEVWAETEKGEVIRNFSIIPNVEGVKLEGKRGFLKWFSHGLSGCGMGIVVGADGVERQVRYHCFDNDVVKDDQGMLAIAEGYVIEWDGEIDMGWDDRNNRRHPALLWGVHVQLISNERHRAKSITASTAKVAA